MAYTKTPIQDTFQTKQIPFVYKWDNRNGNNTFSTAKDSFSVNAVFEPVKDQVTGQSYANAYKRDGTRNVTHAPHSPGYNNPNLWTTGYVTGAYYSQPAGLFFVATDVNMWACIPDSGNTYDLTSIFYENVSYYGPLIWDTFLFDDGTIATLVGGVGAGLLGGNFRMFKGTATIPVVSSTIVPPSPVVGTGQYSNYDIVVLDGYAFTSTSDGLIYNSNLNDPTTWSPSNYITAESYGDSLLRIARSGSYIVALGSGSIEWFYDAANPTGSPLSVYPGATQQVGFWGGFATLGDSFYFLGTTIDGRVSLYKVTGLKLEKISDFTLSRTIQYRGDRAVLNADESYASIVMLNGHSVYVVGQPDAPEIAYDLDTETFLALEWKSGQPMNISQASRMPTYNSDFNLKDYTAFARYQDTSGKLYMFDPGRYQDDGINYKVTLHTGNYDFGTRRMKFGSRAMVSCDQTPSSSMCTLSYSFDDFQNYTFNIPIDLSKTYTSAWRLGAFRKIAFTLTYEDNFPMRFNNLEFDFDLGSA